MHFINLFILFYIFIVDKVVYQFNVSHLSFIYCNMIINGLLVRILWY